MKIKHTLQAVILVTLLICLVVPLRSTGAAVQAAFPAFSDFVAEVMDGQVNVVRGVYVAGILALPVVQQPEGDPGSVSRAEGVATQFSSAAQNHVIGLLAHNYLAGASFSDLKVGQEVRIVYGDGHVDYFRINQFARFHALQPDDRYGGLVDLSSNITYTTQDVFTKFYAGDYHVTFQTCIQQGDNSSWGRLFITAVPILPFYLRAFLPLGPASNWLMLK